jgi:uncharacterized membrane protein YfcA
MVVSILLLSLSLIALYFIGVLLSQARRRHQLKPNPESIVLGAVTNFFDTLGIGSFAPTTAWLKLRAMVPDSFIPATLTTGHALPTIAQALIFIQLIQVDPLLLVVCIGCAVIGAIVGAPLVTKLPVHVVQGFVGVAMVIAATLYALANLNMLPIGGQALALSTPWLVVAALTHFLLGALMTFGIGMYAPSLILLSIMGLNPTAAFPIMMGSCAFLMPVGGVRFARSERIDLRIVLGLAIGGIPAVLLAAYVVKSLPLTALRWGVVVVVLYAAILLLRAATGKASPQDQINNNSGAIP